MIDAITNHVAATPHNNHQKNDDQGKEKLYLFIWWCWIKFGKRGCKLEPLSVLYWTVRDSLECINYYERIH